MSSERHKTDCPVDSEVQAAHKLAIEAKLIAGVVNGLLPRFYSSNMARPRLKILDTGPSQILLVDFDERIVKAVERFADRERISHLIQSRLYNCLNALPQDIIGQYSAFYTNPPWGASNSGESVKVFVERGMEACGPESVGAVVIADDKNVAWSRRVLSKVQTFCLENEFYVQEMQTNLHAYHLDDAPDLKSCNLFLRSHPDRPALTKSYPLHG